MNINIGIIGYGFMGQAIARQLKNDYKVYVFDKDKEKLTDLFGINTANDSVDLLDKVDVVILAVKPQDFDIVLNEIKAYIKSKLIISIAAGITIKYIESIIDIARVVRAMPNIAVKTANAVTCLSKGEFVSEDELDFAENLFDYLGETLRIEEKMMNAATAVSGSGPGFCYDMCESRGLGAGNIDEFKKFVRESFVPLLKAAAQSVGFSPYEAEFLSLNTGNGCSSLLVETKLSVSELKKQVTSKGGTTAAGLEVLHKGGSLEDAVKAAKNRAEELSKG